MHGPDANAPVSAPAPCGADAARSGVVDGESRARVRRIIHVDMDAFYASVEQRDDPILAGRPVVVGGPPNGRGVVAACSYEARRFGIRSAMPSAEAGRRCPDAAFVPPRFDVYRAVSAEIHAVFREFTPLIEPLSLDEAYLDVTDAPLVGGSAVSTARRIKARIAERTGLVASAGVSYNKFLAKLASDHDKPDGLFWVLPGDGEAFVAGLPIGRFHGVGPATEARMRALGIETGADLARRSLEDLTAEFGSRAPWYHRVARGIDDRPVRPSRVRKSVGAERTFAADLTRRADMIATLERLADEVLADLAARELSGSTLTVKVRFADFETLTRAHGQGGRALDAVSARRTLPFLLDRALATRERHRVRLLGVTISSLAAADEARPVQLELGGLARGEASPGPARA